MAKTTVSKRASKAQAKDARPQFTCTPEQERAAHLFLQRTIELQKIIGPTSCGNGSDDILSQINGEYHATVDEFLTAQQRLDLPEDGEIPLTVTLPSGAGLVLPVRAIMANGDLRAQAKSDSFLFAVIGKTAIAYEVHSLAKSRASLRVFYVFDGNGRAQLIDIRTGHFGKGEFRCPACDEDVPELFISDHAYYFACVRCHTTLDPDERARYEATRQMHDKRGVA